MSAGSVTRVRSHALRCSASWLWRVLCALCCCSSCLHSTLIVGAHPGAYTLPRPPPYPRREGALCAAPAWVFRGSLSARFARYVEAALSSGLTLESQTDALIALFDATKGPNGEPGVVIVHVERGGASKEHLLHLGGDLSDVGGRTVREQERRQRRAEPRQGRLAQVRRVG